MAFVVDDVVNDSTENFHHSNLLVHQRDCEWFYTMPLEWVSFTKTGEEVAQIVIDKLKEMNIFHRICGICFDTCSVNTGWERGMERRIYLPVCVILIKFSLSLQ